MIIDLICLSIIITFIVDLSGIVDVIKRLIWSYLYPKIEYKGLSFKPFDCSLCMMFWSGLLYLIITNNVSIVTISLVCFMSFNMINMYNLLVTINDLINKLWIELQR